MGDLNGKFKDNHFWQFNVGHVLMLVAMVGAFLVWWSTFGSLPSKTAEALTTLSSVVKDINDKGTVGSRLGIQQEGSDIRLLDSRVAALEKNYALLDAKLDAKLGNMQAKIDMIAALLEGDKKKTK